MKTRAEYKSKKTNKEIRSTISTVLMIILIVFFSSIYFILKEVNNVDNPIVVVTSGSMEPVIYRGDMLIVKHKEAEDIIVGTIEDKKGDIILYDSNGVWTTTEPKEELIVHRVVGVENRSGELYFWLKGDNNGDIDPPQSGVEANSTYDNMDAVPYSHVRGVVTRIIPKIGLIKLFLDDSGLTIPLTVFLGALLVISFLTDKSESDEKKEETKKKLERLAENDLSEEN